MREIMTIKDVLNEYYSTHPFPAMRMIQQHELNKKLKADLKTVAGFEVLWFLVNKHDINFHPDSVVKVCESLGCDTYEKLEAWTSDPNVSAIKNALELPSRPFELLGEKNISWGGLKDRINSIPNLAENVDIQHADREYQLIPESEFQYLIDTFDGHKHEYIKEVYDCDDFTRVLRGWLSEQSLGNATIGKCWYKGYDNTGEQVVYHSVVAIVTDKNIYCAEPQRDLKFWPIDEPSGMFWTKMVMRTEITKLEF